MVVVVVVEAVDSAECPTAVMSVVGWIEFFCLVSCSCCFLESGGSGGNPLMESRGQAASCMRRDIVG